MHQAGTRDSIESHLQWLQQGIQQLERQINDHIDGHPRLRDDAKLISEVCNAIVSAYMEYQDLPDGPRRDAITQRLAHLNQGDAGALNPHQGKVFEFKPVASEAED